jgi:hypothetical protein
MALARGLVKRLRDLLDWLTRHRWLMVLLIVLLFALSTEGSLPAGFKARIYYMLAGERFDFVGWEMGAVLGKLAYGLVAPQRYLDEQTRHDFFLGYLRLVGDIQSTDWEIQQAYTDPAVENPEAATAELRARLAELRADQTARQPIAEAILEEQTASVLVRNGFGVLGQEFPPVGVHFTPLPMMLIVSPRERIEAIYELGLHHGLDTAQQESIEGRIDSAFDVSSLVTGIGGLGAYPAMLLESSSPNWVAEVSPHEWSHHYLLFRPLGWNYEVSAEARTINETAASIVGKEIGWQVVERYYPELLPPEPSPTAEQSAETQPAEPPAFDFRAEMHATRVHVDDLLAQGKVREAEIYMGWQRQVFVEHGYAIRKLNQAYFAFYGAYADEPGGAAGEDPIGPARAEPRFAHVRRAHRPRHHAGPTAGATGMSSPPPRLP